MFNGICLLPVLLSWMGPAPYLNASRISWSKSDSLTLDTCESPVSSAPSPSKPLTQLDNATEMEPIGNNRLLTQTERKDAETQAAAADISDSHCATPNDSVTCDEIGALLDDLEKNPLHHQNTDSVTSHPTEAPRTLDELIAKCEEYLATA